MSVAKNESLAAKRKMEKIEKLKRLSESLKSCRKLLSENEETMKSELSHLDVGYSKSEKVALANSLFLRSVELTHYENFLGREAGRIVSKTADVFVQASHFDFMGEKYSSILDEYAQLVTDLDSFRQRIEQDEMRYLLDQSAQAAKQNECKALKVENKIISMVEKNLK